MAAGYFKVKPCRGTSGCEIIGVREYVCSQWTRYLFGNHIPDEIHISTTRKGAYNGATKMRINEYWRVLDDESALGLILPGEFNPTARRILKPNSTVYVTAIYKNGVPK